MIPIIQADAQDLVGAIDWAKHFQHLVARAEFLRQALNARQERPPFLNQVRRGGWQAWVCKRQVLDAIIVLQSPS